MGYSMGYSSMMSGALRRNGGDTTGSTWALAENGDLMVI